MAKTEATPAEGMSADVKAQILEALRDPDVATQVVSAASQTEQGRKLLNLGPGVGPPSGRYQRNYRAEPALRVFGGVEVEHGPGFVPLPPSWIARYVTDAGGTTDVADGASIGADGAPVMTPDYKHWLDLQMAGGRIDGEVKSNMATGQFTAAGGTLPVEEPAFEG